MKKIIDTFKKYITIVGIWRVILAFILTVVLLYSPGIVGVIIGKPSWLAINAAVWFAPASPGILIGVVVGIIILIVISPKSKKQALRNELKVTWGEIKGWANEILEKIRRWVRGD